MFDNLIQKQKKGRKKNNIIKKEIQNYIHQNYPTVHNPKRQTRPTTTNMNMTEIFVDGGEEERTGAGKTEKVEEEEGEEGEREGEGGEEGEEAGVGEGVGDGIEDEEGDGMGDGMGNGMGNGMGD